LVLNIKLEKSLLSTVPRNQLTPWLWICTEDPAF
jgi:hypothetical protein